MKYIDRNISEHGQYPLKPTNGHASDNGNVFLGGKGELLMDFL